MLSCGTLQKSWQCNEESIQANLCTQEQAGEFILASDAAEQWRNPIVTKSIHLKEPEAINYPIGHTGYYCVGTLGYSTSEYKAVVEFRNAYGELQASQIAKLPFYGGLTIVYAVLAMYVCLMLSFSSAVTDNEQLLGLPLCTEST